MILPDAVRQVDYRKREAEFVADAPRRIVKKVVDRLLTLFDDD